MRADDASYLLMGADEQTRICESAHATVMRFHLHVDSNLIIILSD